MAETESLTQEPKGQLETVEAADLVIGLPTLPANEELPWAIHAAELGPRVLVVSPNAAGEAALAGLSGVAFLQYPNPPSDRLLNTPSGFYGSFHEVFQISQKVGAKYCLVWNTNLQNISIEVMQAMLNPIRTQGFDLVVPSYVEGKLGTLINSSIIYPSLRALYGKRIRFSMAIDLAFSSAAVDYLIKIDPRTHRPRSQQWITTEAISAGLQICQAALPLEPPRPPESADVSSILAMVLGRLYSDLERNTAVWQRSNGSQSVPTFGEPMLENDEEVTVDIQRMMETFQLGYRNLREIWAVALPPATFLELRKLTTLPAESFRMPNDLWVRIIYDFALAHRQRAINREHLLRAMTPLYLAWAASHTLEVKDASASSAQNTLEKLALAYEVQKPYLLSRWRWPDRFNP